VKAVTVDLDFQPTPFSLLPAAGGGETRVNQFVLAIRSRPAHAYQPSMGDSPRAPTAAELAIGRPDEAVLKTLLVHRRLKFLKLNLLKEKYIFQKIRV
jgi:hypothetical protein